jgi:hypothetical protein
MRIVEILDRYMLDDVKGVNVGSLAYDELARRPLTESGSSKQENT